MRWMILAAITLAGCYEQPTNPDHERSVTNYFVHDGYVITTETREAWKDGVQTASLGYSARVVIPDRDIEFEVTGWDAEALHRMEVTTFEAVKVHWLNNHHTRKKEFLTVERVFKQPKIDWDKHRQ